MGELAKLPGREELWECGFESRRWSDFFGIFFSSFRVRTVVLITFCSNSALTEYLYIEIRQISYNIRLLIFLSLWSLPMMFFRIRYKILRRWAFVTRLM